MSTLYTTQQISAMRPWEALAPPGGPGCPPMDLGREIIGMFYVNKTGCQWRMMPTDLGHGNTIYGYFRQGRLAGLWARLMKTLRQWERQCQRRLPEPSAACANSQSMTASDINEALSGIGYIFTGSEHGMAS